MDGKPLPSAIPVLRIIVPVVLITTFALLITWRLTIDTPIAQPTITLPRLMRQDEITCEWPKFSIWDSNHPRNASIVRQFKCYSTQPAFASLDISGFLTIAAPFSAVNDYSQTKCFYRPLSGTSGNDTQIEFGARVKVALDQFVVVCRNGSDTIYEEAVFNPTAHVQVPSKTSREGVLFDSADPMNPSIAIIIIDDVSSAHFARNLPKTMELMRDEDFLVPSRYSQSFSDAVSNLKWIISGNDNTSLVEIMQERGCLTFSNEEPLSSSDEDKIAPTADINTRPLHSFNRQNQVNEHCLANGKSLVATVLDPLVAFSQSFRDFCTLSITRLRSPRNPTFLGSFDIDLSSALSQLLSTSSNTALFLISPSGLKGPGQSGAVESKTPLLAAWFPSEFRKRRNTHYSAFAWNMDKLFTTRDVHDTLRQLAEGSLPEVVEWKRYGEEHTEVSSLLGEMLPEERNCTTLAIPAENCLCLREDARRNTTVNSDGILFHRVFELVEMRAKKEPCIEGIEAHKNWSFVNAYRMPEKEMEKSSAGNVEWLTISFYVRIKKTLLVHGGTYHTGDESRVWFKAMVRHHISSARLEYVEAVIALSYECFAVHLERLCSVCYSSPFWSLSIRGPNKGFLLDTGMSDA